MLGVCIKNLGNLSTLNLRGKIVIGETAALRNMVEAQSNASVIVLDLANVSAIDAHGLSVLLELRKQSESRGIEFRLMNVTRLVSRVLEITRLDSVFGVTTELEVLSRTRHDGSAPLDGLAACA